MNETEKNRQRCREYYWRNRDVCLAKSRERYANDPKVIARREERRRRIKVNCRAAKRPDKRSREIDGHTVQTFTLLETSRLLDIGHSTVSSWLKRGDIPEPLFRDPILFTRPQVQLMRKLVSAGKRRQSRQAAKEAIRQYWKWH